MVWSDQRADSLTVPVAPSPGQDYVMLNGDQIPSELQAYGFTAAVLFYRGAYPSSPTAYEMKYTFIGISSTGCQFGACYDQKPGLLVLPLEQFPSVPVAGATSTVNFPQGMLTDSNIRFNNHDASGDYGWIAPVPLNPTYAYNGAVGGTRSRNGLAFTVKPTGLCCINGAIGLHAGAQGNNIGNISSFTQNQLPGNTAHKTYTVAALFPSNDFKAMTVVTGTTNKIMAVGIDPGGNIYIDNTVGGVVNEGDIAFISLFWMGVGF